MFAELTSVIRCYCAHQMPVREEQPFDIQSQFFGILAVLETFHQHIVGTSLCQSLDCTLSVFTYYGVHLPVPEAFTVRFRRTVMDTDSVFYLRAFPDTSLAVLASVTQMLV